MQQYFSFQVLFLQVLIHMGVQKWVCFFYMWREVNKSSYNINNLHYLTAIYRDVKGLLQPLKKALNEMPFLWEIKIANGDQLSLVLDASGGVLQSACSSISR